MSIVSLKAMYSDRILSFWRRVGKICLISFMMIFILYFGEQNINALASQTVEVININLGNPAGELKFFPDHLEFMTGQSYKLVLKNPSPIKHYFTAKDFADASWTRKVQVGKVEVKGAIHELELKPDGEAEWVMTPMKSGTYELYCSIAGHKEAGMKGEIVVK
jgi:uncharacterized cupredoxin-like copper-binding protein